MEAKNVTIATVAKLAGVSTMTVSRVMNKSPYVKDSTRKKVLDSITTLGYYPNCSARALTKKITGNIGFIASEDSEKDLAINYLSKCLQQELSFFDYSFVAYILPKPPTHLPAIVTQRKVDGLILVGPRFENEILDEILKVQIPIVLIDISTSAQNVTTISTEYRQGINRALAYLVSLGHTKISFLSSPADYFNHIKKEGFESGHKLAGLNYDRDSIFLNLRTNKDIHNAIIKCKNRGVTALLCGTDILAIRLLFIMHQLGYSVPKDFSVIGFGDLELIQILNLDLTFVKVKSHEIAIIAVRELLNHLKFTDETFKKINISTELVLRNSCQRIS